MGRQLLRRRILVSLLGLLPIASGVCIAVLVALLCVALLLPIAGLLRVALLLRVAALLRLALIGLLVPLVSALLRLLVLLVLCGDSVEVIF